MSPILFRVVSGESISSLHDNHLGQDAHGRHCYLVNEQVIKKYIQPIVLNGGTDFLGWCPLPFTPKALFFDMDGTLVEEESIVELASLAGRREEVQKITERAMAGELDFTSALRERVSMLRGLPSDGLLGIAEGLTIAKGVKEVIAASKQNNAPVFLVSGGFMELAVPLAERLGISDVLANRLISSGGTLTGELSGEVIDGRAKALWMQSQCKKLDCSPSEVATIGDGANDLQMMELSGFAVGFCGNRVLRSSVNCWNPTGNHDAMTTLLWGGGPFTLPST